MSFDTTSSQPVVAATAAGGDTDASSATRASSSTTPPNLDYVFDDPAHGEPGRDRMLVHGIWELGLAVALAAATYLLFRADSRSEEHTSELQSRENLVCRLLLEKKNKTTVRL